MVGVQTVGGCRERESRHCCTAEHSGLRLLNSFLIELINHWTLSHCTSPKEDLKDKKNERKKGVGKQQQKMCGRIMMHWTVEICCPHVERWETTAYSNVAMGMLFNCESLCWFQAVSQPRLLERLWQRSPTLKCHTSIWAMLCDPLWLIFTAKRACLKSKGLALQRPLTMWPPSGRKGIAGQYGFPLRVWIWVNSALGVKSADRDSFGDMPWVDNGSLVWVHYINVSQLWGSMGELFMCMRHIDLWILALTNGIYIWVKYIQSVWYFQILYVSSSLP